MLAVAEQPASYSEDALAALWSRAHTLADTLITEAGERMRVIYPGRRSARAGPDFRDAVLITEEGREVHGDVEIHTSAPGWYSHGHHEDANYNGVVLHVVFSPKGHADTRMKSGMNAPVLALEAVADELDDCDCAETPSLPTLEAIHTSADVASLLDAAGDARLQAKSRGFVLEINEMGDDEALYRGLMDALGYATNRRPFRVLAHRVPYHTLSQFRNEPPATRILAIKAMLLGASGLLSRVDDAEDPSQLRRLYRRMPRAGKPLSEKDWRLFRVRPSNHPAQRIIGMAHILDGCLNDGIAGTFAATLSQGGAKALTARLEHRPYIGRGRARDILINIALPFLHAHAAEIGDAMLSDAAQAAYAAVPKLQDNEITREMRHLLDIGKAVKMTARRQQGMIHLYKATVRHPLVKC